MKLLGLLQLAVAIYAIVMILQSSAETGAKVLWVLLVLIVPLIGLIIWALMGTRVPPEALTFFGGHRGHRSIPCGLLPGTQCLQVAVR